MPPNPHTGEGLRRFYRQLVTRPQDGADCRLPRFLAPNALPSVSRPERRSEMRKDRGGNRVDH